MSNNPVRSTSQPSGTVPGSVVGATSPGAPVPVATTLAGIQTVEAGLTDLVNLDAAERKHTKRVSAPEVAQAPHLVQAVTDHPELKPPKVDPAAITSRLARAAELSLVRVAVAKLLRSIEDTILVDRSQAWADLLTIYETIQVNAKREPALSALVAPMAAVLAKGGRVSAKRARASKKAKTASATAHPPAPATGTETPVTPAAPSPSGAKPAEVVPQVTVVTSGPKA